MAKTAPLKFVNYYLFLSLIISCGQTTEKVDERTQIDEQEDAKDLEMLDEAGVELDFDAKDLQGFALSTMNEEAKKVKYKNLTLKMAISTTLVRKSYYRPFKDCKRFGADAKLIDGDCHVFRKYVQRPDEIKNGECQTVEEYLKDPRYKKFLNKWDANNINLAERLAKRGRLKWNGTAFVRELRFYKKTLTPFQYEDVMFSNPCPEEDEIITEVNKLYFEGNKPGVIYASINDKRVATVDLTGNGAEIAKVSGPRGTKVTWTNSRTNHQKVTVLDGDGDYDGRGHNIIFALPKQNPVDRCDVNNSGDLTALDQLVLLNKLARIEFDNVGSKYGEKIYVDVNGDGSFTPRDLNSFLTNCKLTE